MSEASEQQPQETSEPTGPDLSGIESTLQSLAQGQEELRGFTQQQQQFLQERFAEPAEEPVEQDFSWMDPVNPEYDPSVASQRMEEMIQQRAEQIISQQLTPLQEQQQQMRFEMQARDLVSEYPQLAEPEVARAVAENAKRLVQENNAPPELANEPWFWRLAFQAGRGVELANQENAASGGPEAASLEGGGATPVPPGQDLVDRMFAADESHPGSKVLPW